MTTYVDEKAAHETTSLHYYLHRLRWVWLPISIFGATRLLDGLILAWGSRYQISTARVASSDPNFGFFVFEAQPQDPGILGVATNWDGQWYQLIATGGYESAAVDSGPVATRAWAFPPLYPAVVGAVMRLAHWEFALAAVTVSLVFGVVAMMLLFRIAQPHVGDLGAAGLVALTCLFISGPLLQVAYSESMGLALLSATILLVRHGSYWWAIIPTILLAFTRIITPPLAVVVLAVWFHRRRHGHDQGPRSTTGMVALVAVTLTSAFYWSFLSTALRGTSADDRALALATSYSAGYFGAFFGVSPFAVLLPVGLAVVVARIAWSERKRWGVELSSWAAAYPIFVLAVTPPTTGLVRYLLFAFPFAMAIKLNGASRRRQMSGLAVAMVVLIALQIAWVRFFFLVAPVDGVPTLMP